MNGIFEAINIAKNNSEKAIPINPEDYIGDDGFYYCGKCKTKKQGTFSFPWGEMTVMHLCKCMSEEEKKRQEEWKIKRLESSYSQFKNNYSVPCFELLSWFDDHKNYQKSEKLKKERVSLLKKLCFSDGKMENWRFENDDRGNARLSAAMQRYAESFDDFLEKGQGICLYGDVGVGKSYFAACIANRLTDRGISVLMTNFEWIRNKVQESYSGRQKFIDSLKNYKLFVIDDFGSESDSEYMYELVFSVIDARLRCGLPMIITTNLTKEQLKTPNNARKNRIYSRIIGACYPIAVLGCDRRKEQMRSKSLDVKTMLGL